MPCLLRLLEAMLTARTAIDGDARCAGAVCSEAATHPGVRRTLNQDAWLNRPDLGLWAIADGAGGHCHGDVAAAAVIGALETIPTGLSATETLAQVRQRLTSVHRTLRGDANGTARTTSASTVVVMIARDDHFACLWAGDSRGYRLDGEILEQLTVDHSLVQDLLKAGAIGPAEASAHVHANIITRAVGAGDDDPLLDKRIGAIRAGDRFLLCSDGISRSVADADLAKLLIQGAHASQIVEAAVRNDTTDNATAITIDFTDGFSGDGTSPRHHTTVRSMTGRP
jgi:serine/threonine protein phosphatase Stp1